MLALLTPVATSSQRLLLPKSTALGLNALRLGPCPGKVVRGDGGRAGKRAREETVSLLCMAFDNAATVFEYSGKKVAPSVVDSSI